MGLKSTMRGFLSSRSMAAPFIVPSTVFEVQQDVVAGARIDSSAGRIRKIAVANLEAGCIIPAAHRPNIAKLEPLQAAIREVASDLGGVTAPLGLVLPDSAVRLTLLKFETLPGDLREQESLIRWKLKDVLPFAPEEARISYDVYQAAGGGLEVAALVAREQVVHEYESAFEPLAGEVRLLLPASATLLPLLPKGNGTGELLVHAYSGSVVTAVVTGDRLRLWRYQVLENGTAQSPEQMVAQETARVMASAVDHLGIEVGRAWLCARPPLSSGLAEQVGAALGMDIRSLKPEPEIGSHLSSEGKVFLERYGTTFAGLAAQGRA